MYEADGWIHAAYADLADGIKTGNIDLIDHAIGLGAMPWTHYLGLAIKARQFEAAHHLLKIVNPTRNASINPQTEANESVLDLIGRLKSEESDPEKLAKFDALESATKEAIHTWPQRRSWLSTVTAKVEKVLGLSSPA